MDLKESFRVLRRHGIVTSAVLLLTLVGAVGAFYELPWKYTATTEVLLLNSKSSSKAASGGNPYLSFNSSLVQTANILVIELGAPPVAQALRAHGDTVTYAAQVLAENPENEEPIIQISVSGSNAGAVSQALSSVSSLLRGLLSKLQTNVAPKDRVTQLVISSDSQPSRSSSAKIKPVIGLLGVGLVLTFLIPQAIEGVSSRRRSRIRSRSTRPTGMDSRLRPPYPPAESDDYGREPIERGDPYQYRRMQ